MVENIKQQLDSFTMPLAGYSLIEASAGSGKTYTIVNLYLRLLLRLGDNSLIQPLASDEILVVTFTRAATNEMSQRIRRVMVEYSLILRDVVFKLERLSQQDGEWQPAYNADLLRIKEELLQAQELRQTQGVFELGAELEQTDCFYHLPQEWQEQVLTETLNEYRKGGEDFFFRTLNQLLVEGRLQWAKQRLEQELARDKLQIQTLDSFTITVLQNFGISTAISEFELKLDRATPIIEKALENFLVHEFSSKEMQERLIDIPLFFLDVNDDFKDLEIEKDYFYGYWKQKILRANNLFAPEKKLYFFNLVKDFISRYTFQDIENLCRKHGQFSKERTNICYAIGGIATHEQNNVRRIESARQLYELQIARIQQENPGLTGTNLRINKQNISELQRELREWQLYALRWVYQEVIRLARQERVAIDYGDYHRELLELVRQENSPIKKNIRDLYKFAIIDEFQDTSRLQFALFNEIFIQGSIQSLPSEIVDPDSNKAALKENLQLSSNSRLTSLTTTGKRGFIVIGDPKQAIYGFRGADIFCYFNARSLAQNIYTIAYNFRSERSFVETCNLMFSARKDAFHLAHIEYEFAKPKREMRGLLFNKRKVSPITLGQIENLFVSKKLNEHQYLARIIQIMVKFGELGLLQIDDGNKVRNLLPSDICVIEQRNSDIADCVAELKKVGINTQSNTKINLVSEKNKSIVLQELQLILAAIVTQEAQEVNQSLFSIFSGITFEQANQILNDSHRYSAYLQEMQELHELWKVKGFVALIDEYILRKNLLTQAIAEQDTNPQLFLNLQELRVIVDFVVSKCEFINTNNPYRILKYLENLKNIFTSEDDLELHTPGIEDKEAVKFYTAHGSKGLEFPVVLSTCIAYDATNTKLNLNSIRPNCADFYDLGNEKDKQLFADICDAEKQRLFYVLLTRAKYTLFALSSKKEQKILENHLNKDCYTEYYEKYQLDGNNQDVSYVIQHPAFTVVKECLKEDISLQKYQELAYYQYQSPRFNTLLNSMPWAWMEYLVANNGKDNAQIRPREDLEQALQTNLHEALISSPYLNEQSANRRDNFPWIALNPKSSCADVSLYETISLLIDEQGNIDYELLVKLDKMYISEKQLVNRDLNSKLESCQAQKYQIERYISQVSSWIPLAQTQITNWNLEAREEQIGQSYLHKQVIENLAPWFSQYKQSHIKHTGEKINNLAVARLEQGTEYQWLDLHGYYVLTQPLQSTHKENEAIRISSSDSLVQIAQNYVVPQDLVYQQDLISYSSLKKYTEHLIPLVTESFDQLLSMGKVLKSVDVNVDEAAYELEQIQTKQRIEENLNLVIERGGDSSDQQRVATISLDTEQIRFPKSYLRKQSEILKVQQLCWVIGNELIKQQHGLEHKFHKLSNNLTITDVNDTSTLSLDAMFEFIHRTSAYKLESYHKLDKLLQVKEQYSYWTFKQWEDLQELLKDLVEYTKELLEQDDECIFGELQQVHELINQLQVPFKELLAWLNTHLHSNVFEQSEQHLVNLNNPSFILENLPSGKEFGNKVHAYLEQYHPTQGEENIINLTRMCRDYSGVETQVSKKLIHDVLNYPLLNLEKLAQDQLLSTRELIAQQQSDNLFYNPPEEIDEKQYLKLNSYGYDRVTEWEFDINLALESMDFLGFCEVLFRHGVLRQQPDAQALRKNLKDLRACGTFNGFVDLILFTPQACVVIDYKTDNLGNSLFNYHPKILCYKMLQTGYILQSYIYLTAVFSYCLDYVFTSVDDYQALKSLKFVGIHAFLRGMLKDNDQKYLNSGIYMEIPSHKLLAQLVLHLTPYLPYRAGRMELLHRILKEEA